MSTYTQILYQIVYSTKRREPTLLKKNRDKLYNSIVGILNKKNCHVYQVGGIEDHIHIVTHIHPSVALADLVKDLKLGSTAYIKQEKLFPDFVGWQEGYGAFTYSQETKQKLINYVKNQEEHHKKYDSKTELKKLLKRHSIKYNEKYFK